MPPITSIRPGARHTVIGSDHLHICMHQVTWSPQVNMSNLYPGTAGGCESCQTPSTLHDYRIACIRACDRLVKLTYFATKDRKARTTHLVNKDIWLSKEPCARNLWWTVRPISRQIWNCKDTWFPLCNAIRACKTTNILFRSCAVEVPQKSPCQVHAHV